MNRKGFLGKALACVAGMLGGGAALASGGSSPKPTVANDQGLCDKHERLYRDHRYCPFRGCEFDQYAADRVREQELIDACDEIDRACGEVADAGDDPQVVIHSAGGDAAHA